ARLASVARDLSRSRLALPSSGKGSPREKEKGAIVRKRVKASFDPRTFLAKVGEGKTISKYRKDQIVFLTRTGRGRGFLHPRRQSQAHGRFRARQGSGR